MNVLPISPDLVYVAPIGKCAAAEKLCTSAESY